MLNEFIMIWLAEYGMGWVDIVTLSRTEWGHAFSWAEARNKQVIEVDVRGGKYRLTEKAIQQLTKEQ